ncbi:MAG: uroporphyrinogen decarboxylase [Saprospiraceae bacterium]|nr:uroporphyrinogen decarboxylase [Saprospiraceae bacterium]
MENSLLLKTLRGEETDRVPVWMMRQAGRYLPDYRILREKYSFFERCQNPDLATEITLQPVNQVGVDAAIIFSDILVVPQAMGLTVELIENKGPFLPEPINDIRDLDRLTMPDVDEKLGYVFNALRQTKRELARRVPLIGFAGAPWTLLCYMVEGKGSKTFDKPKSFCYTQPQAAHRLLQMLTDVTITYLKKQVEAGADTVQIFDSWAGLLSPEDFDTFSLPYIEQIVAALKNDCPTIIFAKGAWFALEKMSKTGALGLGLDWCVTPQYAHAQTQNRVTLQGNFDPARLLGSISDIKKGVRQMIDGFGTSRYVANLGHGILPNVPVDHARAFVEEVKAYSFKKKSDEHRLALN